MASYNRHFNPQTSTSQTAAAISRRRFLQRTACSAAGVLATSHALGAGKSQRRPNILFAIADDWSWPHASIYGEKAINTPVFDQIARKGCLFANTFTAAPQCSPNRAATLTGRNIWQIEEAGTHGSIFPNTFPVFPDLLEAEGYHIGFTGKGWAPGNWELGGWKRNPAGPEHNRRRLREVPARGIQRRDYARNFEEFLEAKSKNVPFFFWYGCHEPHRVYERGSGIRAGKNPSDVTIPPFLPDDPQVRSDMLDYFLEIEWFDTQLGKMLRKLEVMGELENTIIVSASDNGMPFPRAKANLYEYGTHVPMAISWPAKIKGGQTVEALTSFIDFAPTFLQAADIAPPSSMTGKSFLRLLTTDDPGLAQAPRDCVLTGRERHTHARVDNLGYPARTIRSADYLYIRNFKPERWPAGDPEGYHDIDDSPTKRLLVENREQYPDLFALAVGKRPAEELYAIKQDPACMKNLAESAEHTAVREKLSVRLESLLTAQQDPRMLGTGDIFESYPRFGGMRPQLGGFAERTQYNPKYQPK